MSKKLCRCLAVLTAVVLLFSCAACGGKKDGLQKVRVCEVTHSIFYAPQYAANPGQMIGEIPVGIETYGNADDPFYPEACNATYKEVWTSPAARFLGTL